MVASPTGNEEGGTTLIPPAVVNAHVNPRVLSQSPHLRRTNMHPLCHPHRLLLHRKVRHLLHTLTKQSRVSLPNLIILRTRPLLTTAFRRIPLPTPVLIPLPIPLPILQCTRVHRTLHRPRQLLTSHPQLHLSRTHTLGTAVHQLTLTRSRRCFLPTHLLRYPKTTTISTTHHQLHNLHMVATPQATLGRHQHTPATLPLHLAPPVHPHFPPV